MLAEDETPPMKYFRESIMPYLTNDPMARRILPYILPNPHNPMSYMMPILGMGDVLPTQFGEGPLSPRASTSMDSMISPVEKSLADRGMTIKDMYESLKSRSNSPNLEDFVINKVQKWNANPGELERKLRTAEAAKQMRPATAMDMGRPPERDYLTGTPSGPSATAANMPKVPYASAPDSLMGISNKPPSIFRPGKGYTDYNYKFEQPVKITLPNGEVFYDTMNGLNKPHALERARRNWQGSKIETATQAEYDDYVRRNP